ncbi:MAG: hypothetical protein HC883_05080, partial [Bdellovibrionaceae bacterium]|nr:hypothetical protein [Pseudobdellovibrionaceae bacterium]
MTKVVLAAWALIQFVGCASTARQSESLLRSLPDIPLVYQITNVPFVDQAAGYCGPATLTMVMRHHGLAVAVDDI